MEAAAIKPGLVPLKVNAFERVRQANSQLGPLFPYDHPGAIIPCTASFESDGSGMHIGYFLHENSVDEVALTVGSNGRLRPGDIFVGPRVHGVGGGSSEAFFSMMVITQRQSEEGEQPESIAFQCEDCNAELYRYNFDASVAGDGAFPGLPTIVGSDAAAVLFNADVERRTCKACGKENRPFPLHVWGWGNYVRNSRIVENAWSALQEASK